MKKIRFPFSNSIKAYECHRQHFHNGAGVRTSRTGTSAKSSVNSSYSHIGFSPAGCFLLLCGGVRTPVGKGEVLFCSANMACFA